MMLLQYLCFLPLIALTVQSITVTSPTEGQNWAATTQAQTVSWQAVSSDPTSFAILLVPDDNQSNKLTLVANQSTSAGSASVSPPSGTWPVGQTYRINLVRSTSQVDSILAQSLQFNITSSGAAGGTVASTTTPSAVTARSSTAVVIPSAATSAGSVSTVATVSTAQYTGNAASGVPPSVTSATGGAVRFTARDFAAFGIMAIISIGQLAFT